MDVRSSDGTVETVRNDVKVLLRVIEERAYPRTTTVTHCKQLSISVCNKTISPQGYNINIRSCHFILLNTVQNSDIHP